MDPLQKAIAAQKEISKQIDALLAKDTLTADEQAQHDKLVADYEAGKKRVASLQEQAKRQEDLDAQEKEANEAAKVANDRKEAAIAAERRGNGRRSEADSNGNIRTESAAKDDPLRGFKTAREYATAVMVYGLGGKMDERLKPLYQTTAGSDEQSGADNNYGGFLVPVGMSPDFLQLTPEADPMAGRVRSVPMDNVQVKFGARVDKNHSTSVSGGLTVSRRPETVAAAASRMQVETVDLTAHSLFGLAYATEEILQDSPRSFAALIAAGFNDQFTSHIINERLNGTGVGEFLGVMNSPCLVTITKQSGQSADTITFANIVGMRSRCWGYGSAIWIANHDTLPQLMLLNQAVGTGGSAMIWQPSAREDAPDILLGRPLIFSEYAKTLGDAGDIVLGNWMEYLEGVYQPLQSAESMHVRFINHERTFKFWLRNAGAPWWKSAMTPKNSTATLSPFVVLEAR